MDLPYSGYASRSAHYAVKPPPPGLNSDHMSPDPEPDPFNPQPDVPPSQAGTVWVNPTPDPGQTGVHALAQIPVSHWFDGQAPVASGVPYGTAQQAMQERLMADHSTGTQAPPDSIRLYQHATEGQANEFVIGRAPVAAGASIPDGPLAGLQNGRNSYDAINQPNEVYAGDPANVGRYRLGVKTNVWGLYENPIGKFGQDASLRAYTGLSPAMPVDKPQMENTAPYTPNSTGTAHWAPTTAAQTPSMFSLPSETSMTDFTAAGGSSEFASDSGGEFR